MDKELMMNQVTDILLVSFVAFIAIYMIILLIERRKREHLLSLHKKKNSAQKIGDRFEFMRDFYNEIDEFLTIRGHYNISDILFYGIIIFAIVIMFSMALTGQFVLAIVYPLIVVWFIRRMITLSQKDTIVEMEETLPLAIDNMIRIFSKYADIKTIIYETSLTTNGPLRKELDFLSRQMNTKNPGVVLEEFSEKYNSVWLNNFGFTLIGYLQDSSKEETVRNLRHLRTILEKENTTKKDAISERKPSLMINYALAVIGVIGAFANIFFNPNGFNFFFHSYLGLFCFTAGFGSVMGTIYMNIKMMKIEK